MVAVNGPSDDEILISYCVLHYTLLNSADSLNQGRWLCAAVFSVIYLFTSFPPLLVHLEYVLCT